MNIRVAQKKERVYTDGRCPLFIRFPQDHQSKYITTGIAVLPGQWDSQRQRITGDYPDALGWNAQIARKLADDDKKIKRLEMLKIKVNFDSLFESNGRGLVITVSSSKTLNAALLSCSFAACISTAKSNPWVSVAMCRFRPLIRFPPSNPHASPPILVVLTLCESIIPILGEGCRPRFLRIRLRDIS